jgi:two-component system CheB/CheR fusion protein
MKNRYDEKSDIDLAELRNAVIGLGEHSVRKTYYPELRRRLAELERFRALVDRINDVVFVLDAAQGTIIDANQTACGLLGYRKDEILGGHVNDFIDKVNPITSADQVRTRGHLLAKDGRRVPIELAVSSIEISGVRYMMSVARDISEQQTINDQLLSATEAAQAASRAKSEFLANMSHEIRTPLNSILGFSELLSETTMNEEQRQFMKMIRQAGAGLLRLIDDILDLSKIEAGKLKLEILPFDLKEMIEGSFEILAKGAAAKGLEAELYIDARLPVTAHGDSHRLRQVITNILGNAIKFTSKGQVRVAVKLESCDDEKCRVLFEIADSGCGISPERMKDLFGRFTQLDGSSTRKFGGTGLGLSISKQLVEMMGGEIWAESELGRGSAFHFIVPVGKYIGRRSESETVVLSPNTSANTSAKPSSASYCAGPCPELNILVAEDSPENRMLIQAFLKEFPFKIEFAEDGLIAVKKFKEQSFDLVLMDMEMPVLDGYSATREMRCWEREAGMNRTPIVAQTAHALSEKIVESKQAGCDLHLAKPLVKSALVTTILKAARRPPLC